LSECVERESLYTFIDGQYAVKLIFLGVCETPVLQPG